MGATGGAEPTGRPCCADQDLAISSEHVGDPQSHGKMAHYLAMSIQKLGWVSDSPMPDSGKEHLAPQIFPLLECCSGMDHGSVV